MYMPDRFAHTSISDTEDLERSLEKSGAVRDPAQMLARLDSMEERDQW